VLSDEFGALSADQRQMLLHEGSGKEVFTAFVEIVLDNSDGRLPVEAAEVTIRRTVVLFCFFFFVFLFFLFVGTVGAKKDEYFLDKKHASKQDIVNFLESAGFSRSNPYYIVQQGKIQELATMSDEARLDLLKEVAGTRVYEERRAESMKIMDESKAKKEQIEGMLQDLASRLDELEEERVELLEFQKLDTTKRSLQYAIYEKDRERAASKLQAIEQQREIAVNEVEEVDRVGGTSDELRQAEKSVKALQARVHTLTQDRDEVRDSRASLLQQVAQIRLELEDARSRVSEDKSDQDNRAKQLKECEKKLSDAEKKLTVLEKKVSECKKVEEQSIQELRVSQTRLDELLQREARAAQFESKKKRDEWLKKQIKSMSVVVAEHNQQLGNVEAEVKKSTQSLTQITKKVGVAQKEFDKHRKIVEQASEAFSQARSLRDTDANKRKELWRKDEDIRVAKVESEKSLAKAEKSLQSTISRDLATGLAAVRKMVAEHNIQGVHGPLLELFEIKNDALQTAVDVTGGNALFHVVVENDDVASLILKKMNEAKTSGRVTFLPLNRLNATLPNYPAGTGIYSIIDDAISFADKFRPAMVHVFGRTVVCATLEQATTVAASHNIDCITLDGDRVDRKGAITGGFVDRKVSRLRLQGEISRLRTIVNGSASEQEKIQTALQKIEGLIAKNITNMRKADEQKEKERSTVELLAQEIQSLVRSEQTARVALEDSQNRTESSRTVLADLNARHDSLVRELDTPFKLELSEEEREELNAVSLKTQQLRLSVMEQSGARSAVEAERAELRELISGNLAKRRAELAMDYRIVFEVQEDTAEAEEKQRDLDEAEANLAESDAELARLEKELEQAAADIGPAQKAFDEMVESGGHAQQDAIQARKRVEELLNERALYLREMDGAKRKIREVGTISSEEFLQFKDEPVQELYNKLHEVQESLQSYTHVNKKAGEQFVSFVNQRDDLMARNSKLDEGQESISNLVNVLDSRKDEAIIRTFKGVAKHFSAVFKNLVPDGEAALTMIKSSGGGKRRKAGADEADAGVQNFCGIKVKASFGGAMGAPQDLALLSGGQKSLVALALIFAIQKADPAPFYLMDEVDAALDSTHRLAVAKMLKEASKESQYIIATFKPELVMPGDNFYKISYANKVSTMRSVNKEVALSTIREDARPQ
jgi:structural maintenance of chromosome 3 (chondroitin sulfate proteoglycan 6)